MWWDCSVSSWKSIIAFTYKWPFWITSFTGVFNLCLEFSLILIFASLTIETSSKTKDSGLITDKTCLETFWTEIVMKIVLLAQKLTMTFIITYCMSKSLHSNSPALESPACVKLIHMASLWICFAISSGSGEESLPGAVARGAQRRAGRYHQRCRRHDEEALVSCFVNVLLSTSLMPTLPLCLPWSSYIPCVLWRIYLASVTTLFFCEFFWRICW